METLDDIVYRRFGAFFHQPILFLVIFSLFVPFLAIEVCLALWLTGAPGIWIIFDLHLLMALGLSWLVSRTAARFIVTAGIGYLEASYRAVPSVMSSFVMEGSCFLDYCRIRPWSKRPTVLRTR